MEFTNTPPEEEGIYWIERTISGKRQVETAIIIETGEPSWGTCWKIIFIGDARQYNLNFAKHTFDLKYGELVK